MPVGIAGWYWEALGGTGGARGKLGGCTVISGGVTLNHTTYYLTPAPTQQQGVEPAGGGGASRVVGGARQQGPGWVEPAGTRKTGRRSLRAGGWSQTIWWAQWIGELSLQARGRGQAPGGGVGWSVPMSRPRPTQTHRVELARGATASSDLRVYGDRQARVLCAGGGWTCALPGSLAEQR